MPRWLALGFQDMCSPSMRELSCLHDHVITIIFRVIVLISYIITYLLVNTKFYKYLSEGTLIETIWSIVPAFLLVILVVPSMKVLYIIEDVKSPVLTFKVVAHQWYWTYIVPFYNNMYYTLGGNKYDYYEYDSVIDVYSIDSDYPRLLGCTEDLFIPVNTTSRLLITSTDVIHSFAVPSLGLKVDALPGRINQLFANPSRVGVFFGQCSEICGSNHSFMPIRVKVCGIQDYDKVAQSYLLDVIAEDHSELTSVSL